MSGKSICSLLSDDVFQPMLLVPTLGGKTRNFVSNGSLSIIAYNVPSGFSEQLLKTKRDSYSNISQPDQDPTVLVYWKEYK